MSMRAALSSLLLVALPTSAGAQSLQGPESIEFHPRLNRTLVSNTSGGNILARAGDGTLSVFTSAPSNPYGIELMAGTLFVLDDGALKGYDIDSGTQVTYLSLPGAGFLNGISSNGIDTIHVSDFSNQTITIVDVTDLQNPVAGAPISTAPSTPNGVVFDRAANRLLIATWGGSAKILALDLGTSATPVTLIQTTLGNIDGIALDCNGAIHVAAWNSCGASGGCLRRFDPPFALNSPPQVVANGLSSPADIDYGRHTGDIAVPQSGNNTVSFHATACEAALFANDFER